jgi:hypothetical protein
MYPAAQYATLAAVMCAKCADHQHYRLAHYRCLISTIRFLQAQRPAYIFGNRCGELWVKQEYLTEGARDWFDIACAVWYEMRGQHTGQEDCICPACIERQYPSLRFQEESQ